MSEIMNETETSDAVQSFQSVWKPSDQELRSNALSSAVAVFSNCTSLARGEVLAAAKEFYAWLKEGA